MELSSFAIPCKTAFDPEIGLNLPLKHLWGRGIGIFLEECNQLDISYWKFDRNDSLEKIYAGRIHIIPTLLEGELSLIEDFTRGKFPENFPCIFERTTGSKEINTSLYYPLSREIWNLRIHYKNDGNLLFTDSKCKFLIADGRLTSSSLNPYLFENIEKCIYSPPKIFQDGCEVR